MSNGPPTSRDARMRAASELREVARGTLDVDHDDVDRVAGLVRDDDLRDLLVFGRQAWERHSDREEPDFAETTWATRRVERAATETATDAVEAGNVSLMDYIIGMPTYENDVSGMHTAARVEDWLCTGETTSLVYIASIMGSGKTDLSLTFLQLVWHYYRRLRESASQVDGVDAGDVPVPDLAANFRVVPDPQHSPDAEVQLLDDYDQLSAWAEGGSSDDVRWFIFDEASTELTAQSGSNAQDVAEVMAPFVKKMRKKGINMIVIGHDSKDVHPAIRTLADFVEKPGKKKARVYEGIKNREPVGHLFDLDRLPPTSWEFDTDDLAEWSWGEAHEEAETFNPLDSDEFREWRNERIRTLYDGHGLTQREVADVMDLSATTVNKVLKESA